MADGARIGLNEVELGIAVPKFWAALMARTVSSGIAEKLCAFAQMADAQQALSIGMVDEVVPATQVVQVCTMLDAYRRTVLQFSSFDVSCGSPLESIPGQVLITGCARRQRSLLPETNSCLQAPISATEPTVR